jgi:hypothetical protein
LVFGKKINKLIVKFSISHFIDMSKQSLGAVAAPKEVTDALLRLGQRLHACRIQRNWSHRDMAERMLCSINTYRALEAGRPGSGVGNLVLALWLLGQLDGIDNLARVPAELASGRRAGRNRSRDDALDF